MTRYRLLVAYDGAPFHGWQVQNDVRTVEGELTAAFDRFGGRPHKVQGTSRTDAGVHALGQVAHVDYDGRLNARELHQALNALIDPAVRVLVCQPCALDFHARHAARGKLYRYALWVDRVAHPLFRAQTLHVRQRLDLEAMRLAATHLVGAHDFSAFRAATCNAASPFVSLHRIELLGEPPEVSFEVTGTAFLKYMVRTLVGTLLEVGRGLRSPDSIADLLASRERALAGPTARPHALHLVWAAYPDDPWDGGAVALTLGARGLLPVDSSAIFSATLATDPRQSS